MKYVHVLQTKNKFFEIMLNFYVKYTCILVLIFSLTFFFNTRLFCSIPNSNLRSRCLFAYWATFCIYIFLVIVTDTSKNSHFKFAVWMGAKSSSPTGPYKWELSGPTLIYQPWYPGEPTNNAQELCVNLLASGMWNNVPCMLRYYFVCKSE